MQIKQTKKLRGIRRASKIAYILLWGQALNDIEVISPGIQSFLTILQQQGLWADISLLKYWNMNNLFYTDGQEILNAIQLWGHILKE